MLVWISIVFTLHDYFLCHEVVILHIFWYLKSQSLMRGCGTWKTNSNHLKVKNMMKIIRAKPLRHWKEWRAGICSVILKRLEFWPCSLCFSAKCKTFVYWIMFSIWGALWATIWWFYLMYLYTSSRHSFVLATGVPELHSCTWRISCTLRCYLLGFYEAHYITFTCRWCISLLRKDIFSAVFCHSGGVCVSCKL